MLDGAWGAAGSARKHQSNNNGALCQCIDTMGVTEAG